MLRRVMSYVMSCREVHGNCTPYSNRNPKCNFDDGIEGPSSLEHDSDGNHRSER